MNSLTERIEMRLERPNVELEQVNAVLIQDDNCDRTLLGYRDYLANQIEEMLNYILLD
jgi:hypothetical protein